MIDSWILATISMWMDRVDKHEVIKLIGDSFTWEDLWEAATEVNKLCIARKMTCHIPKNRDQGDLKDRVAVLANTLLASLDELKGRSDHPVFCVTSSNLANVPGIVKDRIKAEPAVTARLDNIEKMVESLSRGFAEIKSSKINQWPALQVNGVAAHAPSQPGHGQGGHLGEGQGALLGAVGRRNSAVYGSASRERSPSMKRSADAAQLENSDGSGSRQPAETPWSQVVSRNQGRRQRPVQYGTAKVNIAGGEARPFDIVVGNTNPASSEGLIKEVLIEVAKAMPEKVDLDILEVECLTKPRDDGRRIWTKTFRVQVPDKFREHMMCPEAYPVGWTSRKYFPPRAPRPPVPELHPTSTQPPVKKANMTESPNSKNL